MTRPLESLGSAVDHALFTSSSAREGAPGATLRIAGATVNATTASHGKNDRIACYRPVRREVQHRLDAWDELDEAGSALETPPGEQHAAHEAIAEMASPSASSIRMMRKRDAPSDCRSAISRCRTTARASRRLATFAHTMTSVRSRDDRKRSPEGSSAPWSIPVPLPATAEYGMSVTLRRFSWGWAACSRAQMAAISAPACESEAPGVKPPAHADGVVEPFLQHMLLAADARLIADQRDPDVRGLGRAACP